MKENSVEKIGELITVEDVSLPILFSEGKADFLVDEIEKKVRSFVSDISTAKGRKDIGSLAHKIARSKVRLDNAGKQLTADWKAKAKLVDQERSRIWERLETLQEEIRAPLTEYEKKEELRLESHAHSIKVFISSSSFAAGESNLVDLENRVIFCDDFFVARDWEEFKQKAEEIHKNCILALKARIAEVKLQLEIKKREEAEKRLRDEQESRERVDRIVKETAQKARILAEEDIAAKQRIREREKQEEDRKLEIEEKAKHEVEETIFDNAIENSDKMKVYVLLKHEYGIPEIIGIYKNKDTLMKNKDILDDDARHFTVEEHEIID